MTPSPDTVDAVIEAIGAVIHPRLLRGPSAMSSLAGQLLLDSMDLVCLGSELEQAFDIELSDQDVADCDTVADLALAIERAFARPRTAERSPFHDAHR